MHNTTIGLAGTLSHVAGTFQQSDIRLVARQEPCYGTAHHASSNDDDVLFQYEPSKRCGALCAIYLLFYHGIRKNATPVPNFLTVSRR